MKRPIEEPRSEETGRGTRYTHPAFAVVRASRVQGTATLFGSDFEHHGFVTITVARAELTRDLSQDWIHGTGRELIEVRMSEAQWAHFVSTLNSGSGTPCTIDHVGGTLAPSFPHRNSTDIYPDEVRERVQRAMRRVDEAIAKVNAEAETLPKKKREALVATLGAVKMEIQQNLPFVVKSFEEHMETVTEKAKIEVNAYVQNAVARVGLDTLSENARILSLPSGESPDAVNVDLPPEL